MQLDRRVTCDEPVRFAAGVDRMHRECRYHALVMTLRTARAALIAVLILSAIGANPGTAQSQSREQAQTQPPAAALLRPGDVVRLKIWREPDLSGDFQVNESGIVVIPRVGALNVASQSPDSLRTRLFNEFREVLSHSAIEVTFLRRVQILGSVRNPGLYPLDPTMTVGDALAVAGGTTPDGDVNRIELRREGMATPLKLNRGTRVAESAIRSGDQLFIPERRWSARNSGLIATAIAAGASLLVALIVR